MLIFFILMFIFYADVIDPATQPGWDNFPTNLRFEDDKIWGERAEVHLRAVSFLGEKEKTFQNCLFILLLSTTHNLLYSI